jgi:hypothetical protein
VKKLIVLAVMVVVVGCLVGGCKFEESSDEIQQEQQETILKEGTAAVGMPAIKNFRERRLLKEILELRDQEGLVTYTYIVNELTGKLIYLGETIGYGIPYATQFTNPMKVSRTNDMDNIPSGTVYPQADPNGLYSPQSAEGTWVLLENPNGGEVKPVYVEARIIVSPFKLNL